MFKKVYSLYSAFYPSPRFTLSLQSAFYTQSAVYPGPQSAVCSPQSAFYTDRYLIIVSTSFFQFCSLTLLFLLKLRIFTK